ncbi:MAG: 50S ribosomal protein L21 [Nitrospinae bacterium]|nr:50S ribosomal protein L21 [Nitrospinota bacterium]
MYAVLETGGKQYKVAKGDVIQVEKLECPVGQPVRLEKVLLVGDGSQVQVGNPFLQGCVVTGEITEQLKAKKILVFKKRRRKNYRRKNGHRQLLTRVKITEISK